MAMVKEFWRLFWQNKKAELKDVYNGIAVKSLVTWFILIFIVCLVIVLFGPGWLNLGFLWIAIAVFIGCLIYVITMNVKNVRSKLQKKVRNMRTNIRI